MRVAERALRALPARAIVRALADAAERWRDVDFPPRVRAIRAIRARTGYSEPVVGYALDALFGEIEYGRAVLIDDAGVDDALVGLREGRAGQAKHQQQQKQAAAQRAQAAAHRIDDNPLMEMSGDDHREAVQESVSIDGGTP